MTLVEFDKIIDFFNYIVGDGCFPKRCLTSIIWYNCESECWNFDDGALKEYFFEWLKKEVETK